MSIIHFLDKETTVDNRSLIFGYSASTLAALVGLIAISFLPIPHQEKERQAKEWVKRREEDEQPPLKAQRRRLLRQKFKQVDQCKLGREKASAKRKAKLMKQYREVFSQYPALTYNIH
jgi:hypothetical protein